MPTNSTDSLADLLPLTPDVRAARLVELKRLFPDLFTNEGRLNPDELRQLVEPNEVHETERYEFKWYGKAASKREAFTPTTATLVYDEARSVNPDKADGNMIIEGENLESLKLLLNAYREQVKCIYIDPPYNTGKDFVYSDRFAEGQKSYLEQIGVTEDGVKINTNSESDGRFHSNWLSMMHSRLLVARSLLSLDGVIFVSIDDNEVQNLRRIMDEVFGEENFVASVIWQKKYSTKADSKFMSESHDYIIVFARNIESLKLKGLTRTEEQESIYKNPDNDPRGSWTSDNLLRTEEREYAIFGIVGPTGTEFWPPKGSSWRYNSAKISELKTDNRIWFGENRDARPRLKRFRSEVREEIPAQTIWSFSDVGHTDEGTKEVATLFDGTESPFSNPKPSRLLNRIFALGTERDSLVLDFFGGSGTAAHAAMDLNKSDGGTRKYIMVQIPERTIEASPASRAGFKKISDITIERAKRVIAREQIASVNLLPNDEKRNFAESLGFKVYKLQKSNFPRCEFKPDSSASEDDNVAALRRYIEEKEAAFFLTLDPNGEQAVFDEVLLKNGFQLHYTRTRREDFTNNTVFEVGDARRSALVCLAWSENIHDSTIKRLRELSDTGESSFFICLERSLSTTSKWNLKHFLGNHFNAF